MSVIRFVKKVFWGTFAVVISVFAWFTNALQMIKNVLILVLDLPKKALAATIIYISVVYCIACLFIGGEVLNVLIKIVSGCLALFLMYKLFQFLYSLVFALIDGVLNFLNLDGLTNVFATLLQKSIYRYMGQFGSTDPTKTDRLLFAFPWLMHKINWLFERLSTAVSFVTCTIFGGAGAYLSWNWIFAFYNTGDYGTVDYIVGWATIVFITVIAIYLGHCLSQAIQMATESARPLDDLFRVYAEFFRNTEGGGHTNSTGSNSSRNNHEQHQYDYHVQHASHEDNPYYQVLDVAQSAEELQSLYRSLAKKLHPDVCKEYSVETATKLMAQLNNAYNDLKKHF